jgi:hypothetical protein
MMNNECRIGSAPNSAFVIRKTRIGGIKTFTYYLSKSNILLNIVRFEYFQAYKF